VPDADRLTLLGGAERRKVRKRGFAPWTPKEAAQAILVQVKQVLAEYLQYLPLTCRQVFYRLVGAHGYPKTEADYDRLCEVLNRARRAGLVDMADIRDDGGQTVGGTGWASATEFIGSIHAQAEHFRLDRTAGQALRLAVMCEAAGMVPQLADVTDRYDISVISSGGLSRSPRSIGSPRA
jgi:hypothetical protein